MFNVLQPAMTLNSSRHAYPSLKLEKLSYFHLFFLCDCVLRHQWTLFFTVHSGLTVYSLGLTKLRKSSKEFHQWQELF